ncbi:MAG: CBS domain-containing protein [Acidobacteriota bacterium]
MRVHDIMTRDVATCGRTADLASAALQMKEFDCGFLPVIDPRGHVAGVVTDRDIMLTLADTRRPAHRVSVEEAMSGHVYGVSPSDDVTAALELMKTRQVRRLPVMDASGLLMGVVSLNDIILRAEIDAPAIVRALEGISAHAHVTAPA